MITKALPFGHGRILVLGRLGDAIECVKKIPYGPFAVMLPGFNDAERSAAENIVAQLIDSGCGEFGCIGEQAEQLHDAIDWIVEDKQVLKIVTTWHHDIAEGCDYFVAAAGGGTPGLVALVLEHVAVVDRLRGLVMPNRTAGAIATASRERPATRSTPSWRRPPTT